LDHPAISEFKSVWLVTFRALLLVAGLMLLDGVGGKGIWLVICHAPTIPKSSLFRELE